MTLTDSAGVTIVWIPAPELEALPVQRASALPDVSIGRVEGPEEELLGFVADATRLDDGRFAVADAQQRRILVYGPDGRFQHTIGRPGEGPGEFRSLARLWAAGDTLFVTDLGASTIHAFRTDGAFLDLRRVQGGVGLQLGLVYERPHRWISPHIHWSAPDGYPDAHTVRELDGPHRVAQVLARYDTLGGTVIDTLASAAAYWVRLSPAERQAAEEAGIRPSLGNIVAHPLAPTLHATFVGDRPVTGWSSVAELRIHTPEGGLQRLVRFDWPAPELAWNDERHQEWVLSFRGESVRPIEGRAGNVLVPPDTTPRFFRIAPGREGDLWLAVAPAEVEPGVMLWTRWLRFTSDGQPAGWLLAPPLDLIEIGRDGLLARERDALGVQRVTHYRYLPVP